MISAVILGLALVTPGFAVPLTTTTTGIGGSGIQETTGIHDGAGIFTQGEKTGIQGTLEGSAQQTFADTLTSIGEKTGAQGSAGYFDQKTSGVDAARPLPTHEAKAGTPEVYTPEKYPAQQVEQNFVQGSPETYNQKYTESHQVINPTVQKEESEQVSSDKVQFYLPVQPLYVTPESQSFTSGQKLTPVVVPAETIAAGRVIIMTVEPLRQGFIQQEVANPEKQTSYQQVAQQSAVDYVPVQGVEPTQQQLYNAQPETIPQVAGYVEKQTPIQQGSQSPITGYNTVSTQGVESQQTPLTRSQPLVATTPEKQSAVEYTQPEFVNSQLSGSQQVVGSNFEKQTSQSGYNPVQGLQQSQQQTYTSNVEKQGSYQQTIHPENQPNRLPQKQVDTAQQQIFPEKQGVQGASYTQTQGYKSQEAELNQQHQHQQQYVQPQVAGYVANNFGEKLPQQVQPIQVEPVQTLSSVSYKPEQSVKPSSVVPQQQVSPQ